MTIIDDKIRESINRANKAADAVSDDFGHSVQACIEWQVQQLEDIADDTERVSHALKVAVEWIKEEDGNSYVLQEIERILEGK